jgi:MFS superfamily sulfate permease-like transporter
MAGTPIAALFFAAAMDFEEEAPKVGVAKHPGVIMILRGRHNLGSTTIAVFERYAKAIHDNGGKLFLAEVSASVRAQLEKTGAIDVIGADNVLPAGNLMFASLQQVNDYAQAWVDRQLDL